jgi:hypothetical protein
LSASEENNDNFHQKTFDGILPDIADLEFKKSFDIYGNFIQEAKVRAQKAIQENTTIYSEVHHILPRHSGGADDPNNLVVLLYHIRAHYIRWVQYNHIGDKIAYSVMAGENIEARKIKTSIAGSIGGPLAQQLFKKTNKGWFNYETQRVLGIKGAAVNRLNKTGGFDRENLNRANEALQKKLENTEEKRIFEEIQRDNLKKGLTTQKNKQINVGNVISQRLKSVSYHGVLINNKRYYIDKEQRTYLCDTTLNYYLEKSPKRPPKKKIKIEKNKN